MELSKSFDALTKFCCAIVKLSCAAYPQHAVKRYECERCYNPHIYSSLSVTADAPGASQDRARHHLREMMLTTLSLLFFLR